MNHHYKFRRYCINYQLVENYEFAKADNFEGWILHHRNGLEFSTKWLKKNNMYYHRTDPHEFKFLTVEEHAKVHGNCERNLSQEEITMHRLHMSESTKKRFSNKDSEDYKNWYEASTAAQRTPERRKQVSEQCKGKGNPMYGKDAWAISCSRKTPEQIEATRQSKREKMKAFWASPEGQIRKKQMAEHVSETKRRNKEEFAHGRQV